METEIKRERQRIRKKRAVIISDPTESKLTVPQAIIVTVVILFLLVLMLKWWVF